MTAVSRDQLAIPTGRRRARPTLRLTVGRRSVWVVGAGAVALLDALDIRHAVCGVTRTTTFPVAALPDVLALAEAEHRPTVLLDGTGWPTAGRRSPVTRDTSRDLSRDCPGDTSRDRPRDCPGDTALDRPTGR